jgi:hypothetical protein
MTSTIAREVTEWYPADAKPVHVGVYETSFDGIPGFSEWSGIHWGNQYESPDRAKGRSHFVGFQKKIWRGLLSPAC